MANETVKACIEDIQKNLTQKGSSKKDESRVMKAMLNDITYKVGVFGKDGLEGEYCPAEDYKNMCVEIVTDTTHISAEEAIKLIQKRDASKVESDAMVRIGKEFILTYMQTNRKLPLGCREHSDVSFIRKEVPETTKSYPRKVGVNEDGTPRYSKVPTTVPAHDTIKVQSGCPMYKK